MPPWNSEEDDRGSRNLHVASLPAALLNQHVLTSSFIINRNRATPTWICIWCGCPCPPPPYQLRGRWDAASNVRSAPVHPIPVRSVPFRSANCAPTLVIYLYTRAERSDNFNRRRRIRNWYAYPFWCCPIGAERSGEAEWNGLEASGSGAQADKFARSGYLVFIHLLMASIADRWEQRRRRTTELIWGWTDTICIWLMMRSENILIKESGMNHSHHSWTHSISHAQVYANIDNPYQLLRSSIIQIDQLF